MALVPGAATGTGNESLRALGRERTPSGMAGVVPFLVSRVASRESEQEFAQDGASTRDPLGMAPRLADLEAT